MKNATMATRCCSLSVFLAFIVCLVHASIEEEEYEVPAFAKMPPVRNVLKRSADNIVETLRGGASENIEDTIAQLGLKYGPNFLNAIEQVRERVCVCSACGVMLDACGVVLAVTQYRKTQRLERFYTHAYNLFTTTEQERSCRRL